MLPMMSCGRGSPLDLALALRNIRQNETKNIGGRKWLMEGAENRAESRIAQRFFVDWVSEFRPGFKIWEQHTG